MKKVRPSEIGGADMGTMINEGLLDPRRRGGDPKPHDRSICRNCNTEIEWASERAEEGWAYGWYHLPVITGQSTGAKRCPIYAEPV